MVLELNVVVIALLLTAVTAVGIALFARQRRERGEWTRSFTFLALTVAIWTVFYALEVASVTQASKLFWAKVGYIGIVSTPVAWCVFSIQYTGRAEWLTPQRTTALGIIPGLTLFFVFMNDRFGLIWPTVGMDESGIIAVLDVTHGTWFWLHSAYSYTLILIGMILIIQAYIRYPKAYRRQNAALVAGAMFPLVANIIFLSGILPIPHLDLTTFAFTISCLLMANAIFRYQLFDIVPVARRTAVDNMRDGMLVLDLQNRVIDINPAALALYRRDASEMIGQPLEAFLQDQPEIMASFRHTTEAETEISVLFGKELRHFALHISPLRDSRAKLRGRMIVFYDITTHKQSEQNLARARDKALEASRFKSELLSRVSHELRTPLNVILGYTEMLQEGIFGGLTEEQREPTQKIIESTDFLTRQVNELLDLSKLEVGKLPLHNQEFTIADVVKRVHHQMHVLANNKQVKLISEIQKEVPSILYGDPVRIEQILLNLIGNGIKFSEDGVVKQSIYLPDASHWALQVSDQGVGIPPELHATIFDPFKQIDGSLTRLHSGTGLGLAIVKELTALMDGKIVLESEVGQGSKFTVYLPLIQQKEHDLL